MFQKYASRALEHERSNAGKDTTPQNEVTRTRPNNEANKDKINEKKDENSTNILLPNSKPSFKKMDVKKIKNVKAIANPGFTPDTPQVTSAFPKMKNLGDVTAALRGTNKAVKLFRQNAEERIKMNAREKLKERMRLLVQERLSVRQIFRKYVESSTLHGFVYTCSHTFFIRRFIWACLMILGAIYFLLKFYDAIILYVQFPFSTQSTLEYVDKLQLPAISFCTINQFRYSKLQNSSIKRLIENKWLPLGNNWRYPGFDVSGEQLAKDLIHTSITMEEIFAECDFIRRDTDNPGVLPRRCGVENFTTYISERGQLCYTLNSGKPGHHLLEVDQEGLNCGYELVVDVKNEEVLKIFDYTGLQIIIHDPAEPPVSSNGFFITPGSKSYVRLTKAEVMLYFIDTCVDQFW